MTEIVNLERNYFEQYGASMTVSNIIGTLLKFNKGDWLSGQDEEEVAVGTRLTAMVDTLQVGWLKWEDGKPSQQLMGLVAEGFQPPRRKELGDTDEGEWDVDETTGKPRDPWQFSNYLLLRPPGLKKVDDEDMLTFATSSRGGLNAIGDICKTYGKEMRQRPDMFPIIELGVDAYNHSNRQFGRIKIPVMKIIDWEPKEIKAVLAPPVAPAAAQGKAKRKTA